jgi:NADP-dependent 3-hydroxy acid dehydrogenase YdfG
VLSGRREAELTETRSLCAAEKAAVPGGETLIVVSDINEEEGVKDLFRQTVDKFGELLVRSAGSTLQAGSRADLRSADVCRQVGWI